MTPALREGVGPSYDRRAALLSGVLSCLEVQNDLCFVRLVRFCLLRRRHSGERRAVSTIGLREETHVLRQSYSIRRPADCSDTYGISTVQRNYLRIAEPCQLGEVVEELLLNARSPVAIPT